MDSNEINNVEETTTKRVASINCSKCNSKIDIDFDNPISFCPYCSTKLMADKGDSKKKPRKVKLKAILISVGVCTGAIIIGLSVYLYLINRSIKINSRNFPDDIFRSYVRDEFDDDNDGKLSKEEIEYIEEIDVSECGIESLDGIEYFGNLKSLICDNNEISEINVRRNVELQYLRCNRNDLTELDVSKNVKLKELYCFDNYLTELDVSNNAKLEKLYCGRNQLSEIDVSKNTELEELLIQSNPISSIFLKKNTNLIALACSDTFITEIDVSKNTELQQLICGNCSLTELDVSNCRDLMNLGCAGNSITSLDVSNNRELQFLTCNDNQLTELDISSNLSLRYLQCEGNRLDELDISNSICLLEMYLGEDGNVSSGVISFGDGHMQSLCLDITTEVIY